MQTKTSWKEVVTWAAIAILFLWNFRLTKLIGETQKFNESMTTQILNVLVAIGKKVGVNISVQAQ